MSGENALSALTVVGSGERRFHMAATAFIMLSPLSSSIHALPNIQTDLRLPLFHETAQLRSRVVGAVVPGLPKSGDSNC